MTAIKYFKIWLAPLPKSGKIRLFAAPMGGQEFFAAPFLPSFLQLILRHWCGTDVFPFPLLVKIWLPPLSNSKIFNFESVNGRFKKTKFDKIKLLTPYGKNWTERGLRVIFTKFWWRREITIFTCFRPLFFLPFSDIWINSIRPVLFHSFPNFLGQSNRGIAWRLTWIFSAATKIW